MSFFIDRTPYLALLRRGDLEAVDGLQEPRLLVEKLSQRQLPPLPDLCLLDSFCLRVPPLVEFVVENLKMCEEMELRVVC